MSAKARLSARCQHSVVGGTLRFVSAAPKSPADYLLPRTNWSWALGTEQLMHAAIADDISGPLALASSSYNQDNSNGM